VLALHCSGPSGGRIVAGGRPTRTGQEVGTGTVIPSQATKGDKVAHMLFRAMEVTNYCGSLRRICSGQARARGGEDKREKKQGSF
jgi:hypothetical protein